MRKKELRQRDILKLIEGLDISPTMYKNATEKYNFLPCDVVKQYLPDNLKNSDWCSAQKSLQFKSKTTL